MLCTSRGDLNSWFGSTLGASAEDRLSGDANRLRLVKWALDDFQELVAEKLKAFEREHKELHMLLFPEVCSHSCLPYTELYWCIVLCQFHDVISPQYTE